jgi:membrane dipeptidase
MEAFARVVNQRNADFLGRFARRNDAAVTRSNINQSRRRVPRQLGAGALAAMAPAFVGRGASALAQGAVSSPQPLLMDGHVHITNRVYWEKIDPWQPHDGGWDYARARAAGVNCIIDYIGTYGYWNYNYTPKQALRLIETFHRFAESHADKMGVALSVADARKIIASGRIAGLSRLRVRI